MYTREEYIEDRELRVEKNEVGDLLETGQTKVQGMSVFPLRLDTHAFVLFLC